MEQDLKEVTVEICMGNSFLDLGQQENFSLHIKEKKQVHVT